MYVMWEIRCKVPADMAPCACIIIFYSLGAYNTPSMIYSWQCTSTKKKKKKSTGRHLPNHTNRKKKKNKQNTMNTRPIVKCHFQVLCHSRAYSMPTTLRSGWSQLTLSRLQRSTNRHRVLPNRLSRNTTHSHYQHRPCSYVRKKARSHANGPEQTTCNDDS